MWVMVSLGPRFGNFTFLIQILTKSDERLTFYGSKHLKCIAAIFQNVGGKITLPEIQNLVFESENLGAHFPSNIFMLAMFNF